MLVCARVKHGAVERVPSLRTRGVFRMPARARKQAAEDGVQAVMIAVRIIEHLAFGQRFGRVTELARELGTTKNRIHRHLRTLVDLGYVAQDPDTQRYTVGVRLVQMGNAVASEYDFLSVSRPVMQRLRDALGYSVVVSKVENGRLFALDQIQGRGGVTFGITVGMPLGLHNSAQGKIVLAFGDPAVLEEVLAQPLPRRTASTIVDPETLRAEVALARERGWATAPGEHMTGMNAIAAPIFDRNGRLFGTLATVMSTDDLPGDPDEHHARLIKEAAAEISGSLSRIRGRSALADDAED